MPPEDEDFHVDLTFSGRDKPYTRPVAIVVASVAIIVIIATMTTNLAAYLVPMSDEYLQVLVPVAADGAEPLALKSLQNEIMDKTITVHGMVENRTDYVVSNVVAVVEMQETTGRFPQTVEVPVQPGELQAKGTGEFMASATLQERPASYFIKFRLADDGPFLPHKDERALNISLPTISIPAK